MPITLRFHSAHPEAIRDALHNLDMQHRRFLGLPDTYRELYPRVTFPVINGRPIFAEITIPAETIPVWLVWSEHAALCGLISSLPDILEPFTQSEESE